ncbi:MAG: DUF3857 domain-containing protein [Prevotellaceae bacterium]|jgi:predicted Zn-dependent protease|nr:DUF3857 domain-containing protein [Prevotellaceae bacterium]
MKPITLILLFALCLLSVVANAAGAAHYYRGWAELNTNNRHEARRHFELAVQDADTRTAAHLCLALIDWYERNDAGAFAHFQSFYENSPNPYPYLYALFSLLYPPSDKALPDAQRAFFEKIVTDPAMHGTLKAMIYQHLGNYYIACNNRKKAGELYAQIHAIDRWQVLGAFDNISGSGFDKDWGALANADTSDRFRNKADAEVYWYTPSGNRPDGWFDFDLHFTLNDAIFYAQSFVSSPVEQEAFLRVGTSGSLKVWINDAQVLAVAEERNCDLDIYACRVKLNAGANRILVQIGQSEITRANFLLRLTDVDGRPLPGLAGAAEYAGYRQADAGALPETLPFFAEDYFEKEIEKNPDDLLPYIALGETFLRNDKAYEGTHILKKAEQRAPQSAFISYRLSEAYLRSGNATDYSREIENVRHYDPESFLAMQYAYEEAVESEKYTEAEDVFHNIIARYGENRHTDDMEIHLASLQKRLDDFVRLARKLYLKYPDDYDYMYLNVRIEENIFHNTKAIVSILEKYCKKYFDRQAVELLSVHYFNSGNINRGLDVLKKRRNYMPHDRRFLYFYASVLQQMQRYGDALKALDDVKKQAPSMSQIYSAEGYIYKELKNYGKAKECFTKAVYYAPASYDSRTQLRLLENKKEMFDLFPKNNLDSLIAQAPSTADYPEEKAVVLLNDEQLVFYPEGAQEHRTELAIKILNQAGIEQWKEYGIPHNRNSQKLLLDKYEVIKANGQRIKAETDNDGRVVFTNLEPGDVLHLDYRIQDFYSGIFSKHFYDWALMQYSLPLVYSRYAILAPADKPFNFLVGNDHLDPVVTEIENMKRYQWIVADRPAVKDEPYMSPMADVVPVLVFSSIPDWKLIGDWYRDVTANKINAHPDYVFRETFAEILKGRENASPMEKAQAFYEYILNNITYSNVAFLQSNFIPQKASRTIITRLGDCKDMATLFVALCREAGIKANLVLLNTRENGKNPLALPSSNFNHCIAQLTIDDKTTYLELTNNKLPFGAAVISDLQAAILPIPYRDEPTGDRLLAMNMDHRRPTEVIRYKQLSLTGNDLKVEAHNIRTGELAAYYKHKYENMSADERQKDMHRIIASDWKNTVKLTDLEFANLDNLRDSVDYRFKYEVSNALQEVAGMKIFRLPWSDAVESLSMFAPDERKYPFELYRYLYSDSEYERITLLLPEGKKLIDIPNDVHEECAAATYDLAFRQTGHGVVEITRRFVKRKDLVTPDEYPDFKRFMTLVSTSDEKQYAIK